MDKRAMSYQGAPAATKANQIPGCLSNSTATPLLNTGELNSPFRCSNRETPNNRGICRVHQQGHSDDMAERLEHKTCKQKVRDGFVQSGKQKSNGHQYQFQTTGKEGESWKKRQIILRDIQENNKQQPQDVAQSISIKHKEHVFKQRAVKHWSIAQRGCRFSILLRTFKFCLLSP